MFKTDKKSLEYLSFRFEESDISRLKFIVERLDKEGFLSISKKDAKKMINGLNEIGKLKLDQKIYAFHVFDNCALNQGGPGEGIELYQRQGDRLEEYYAPGSRDYVCQADKIIQVLKEKNISKVYTGDIPKSGFLGMPQEADEDDPITWSALKDYEITEFKESNIKVVKLDSLI